MTVEEAREDVLSWWFGMPPQPVREVPEFVEAVDRLIEAARYELGPPDLFQYSTVKTVDKVLTKA